MSDPAISDHEFITCGCDYEGCPYCGICKEHKKFHMQPLHENVLEALIELRKFMWSEGYADQTPAMAQADAAIAKAQGR